MPTPTAPALPTADTAASALEELRSRVPLVQSLTNIVSANFLTNVLLASGATNAVIDNHHEAAFFAKIADAVLINLGTPTDGQAEAFTEAARSAHDAGRPWVLDPVGVGGLPWRTGLAADLLAFRPTAIRGNASEITAVAGLGGDTRGVDSSSSAADAVPAALALLTVSETVSASGPVDYVVGRTAAGDTGTVRVLGGSDLLPKVTATGCSLGALSAAYIAVAPDAFTGLVAAHTHFAVASEIAERGAQGPGTFVPAFLDALAAVDPDAIRKHGRVEAHS
ncbi:hydroxyethylthiazole kinase [Actinacidiphila oryziradicis]|jgi:hydroxyethylthiazole kinase|uniref:hydroxyethylthiazole kinase n=1 Tax=Actinacidiphila oryziradicis TaxID=2571141 RepID=UPI0023F0051E|nr:hydroxyethylthiazole kinase [Actinacidiphila oryziradicis]MCW2874691.1 hydroxyethylthiazole kinase [Actinacidiphila oryziradicis]